MVPDQQFVIRLRSMLLDAFNNHLMHIQMPDLAERYETKEDLLEMLSVEAGYLQRKRDMILSEINAYLVDGH